MSEILADVAEYELFWPWKREQRESLEALIREDKSPRLYPFSALSWDSKSRSFTTHTGEIRNFDSKLYQGLMMDLVVGFTGPLIDSRDEIGGWANVVLICQRWSFETMFQKDDLDLPYWREQCRVIDCFLSFFYKSLENLPNSSE